MNRHTSREVALKMIFQMDVGKNSTEMANMTLNEAMLSRDLSAFSAELAYKAFAMKDVLDDRLKCYLAEDWSIDRLANVDKNILRLALYEILYIQEIPTAVSIDEAIELAKTFGSSEAPAFVNAVLDNLIKADLKTMLAVEETALYESEKINVGADLKMPETVAESAIKEMDETVTASENVFTVFAETKKESISIGLMSNSIIKAVDAESMPEAGGAAEVEK